jgi:hypothetical protein
MMECPPESTSLLTIEDEELPYTRLVSLTTPSLRLELDWLSLTVDFLQVLAGRLSIVQVDEDLASSRGYQSIDVKDIPTAAELRMDCFQGANELTFQLQTPRRGPIRITFVWEQGRE